jgi:hypothetical protein
MFEMNRRFELTSHGIEIPTDHYIKMPRFELRRLITGTLDVFDRHVVSAYINWLVNNGFIEPNPTSEFNKANFIPTNDSRYLIIIDRIESRMGELHSKLDTHTPPLSQFASTNKPDGVLVQKEETVTLRELD